MRLGSIDPAAGRTVVLDGMRAAVSWLEAASRHWGCGGFAARYNLWRRRYQGPYPETTGYLVPTVLRLAEAPDPPASHMSARSAGRWLLGRQRDDGSMRCNIDETAADAAKPDRVVLFDCGAILQGFAALARAGEPLHREAALRLGRFLVGSQRADGVWDKHLYFPTFGNHNALVAYALIEAGAVTGETAFADAGLRCLGALRPRILSSGFIEGCEFGGDPGTMFLHPYAYTLEGYVKSAFVLQDDDLLSVAAAALDRMAEQMEKTGDAPAAYLDRALAPASDYAATTGLAQLADLLLKVGLRGERKEFLDPGRRIMNFLRARVAPPEAGEGEHGGIPASFPVGGGYGPYSINNWTLKYFLDASLEELTALDAANG